MFRPTVVRMGVRSVSCALVLAAAALTMAFTPPWSDQTPVESLLRPSLDAPATAGKTEATPNPITATSLIGRWSPWISEASRRFGVPRTWIRAVLDRESGGRTVTRSGSPITSRAGAMGLMQLMPDTYDELRQRYGLGADPYDPHDNILAGAAYLAQLRAQYGYPNLFVAYNHGPRNLERHLADNSPLPHETRDYLIAVTAACGHAAPNESRNRTASRHRRHRNDVVALRLATL